MTRYPDPDRRDFLRTLSVGSAGLALIGGSLLTSRPSCAAVPRSTAFDALTGNLLAEWCEGMLRHQIQDPTNPTRHGALQCPACGFIHGRCWEALYPLMHQARATGEQRHLAAAIQLFDWSATVTGPDGRWTNDIEPNSWSGTTIFGAIALAEALKYHGDLLDSARREAWSERLRQAVEGYIAPTFTSVGFTNVNYGFTALHGFRLFGELLDEPAYLERSREFATQVTAYFTEPNVLIFGEGKPRDGRSAILGLRPIDLGYNVEESLNGAVLYALAERDEALMALLTRSLRGHLQFMLPDGGWDNSWGTRMAKWTYWGSRTSDGCQPAFALMADRDPAFGAAALRNTELMQRCTHDGLLHGGLHYHSHGVPPCIHHTFTHAKALTIVLDHADHLPPIERGVPLPREVANGVTEVSELAVWLAARGPWRATVSAYDALYWFPGLQSATGGALALLYHERVGPLFAASMARYLMVEPKNMQPQPGEDIALTPRLERRVGDRWFTNLFDLAAEVRTHDDGETVAVEVRTTLRDADRQTAPGEGGRFDLRYTFDATATTITVRPVDSAAVAAGTSLVLPLISASGEALRRASPQRVEIVKPGGTVVVAANVPLSLHPTDGARVFNMVPGAEALVLAATLPTDPAGEVICQFLVQT